MKAACFYYTVALWHGRRRVVVKEDLHHGPVRGEGRHGRIHMGVGRRARETTLTEPMYGMAHASVWCPWQSRLRGIRSAQKI